MQFQLPSLSRSGLKVPGGVVGLSPILVFSLILSQAEQQNGPLEETKFFLMSRIVILAKLV